MSASGLPQRKCCLLRGLHLLEVGTASSCPPFDQLECLAQPTLSPCTLSNIMGASGKVAKQLSLQAGG